MINRINEFLLSLDRNKKILVYFAVFLFISLLGGFFNFYLYKDISLKKEELNKLNYKYIKFIREISKAKKNIKNLKLTYNKKLKTLSLLKDDFKYLVYNIHLSNIYITEDKFYLILKKILYLSSKFNIDANFFISKDNKKKFLTKYIVTIKGKFPCYNYFNYLEFLKNIEIIDFIKEIKEIYMQEDKDNFVDFNIRIVFWSVK